ncbi:MAG: 1-acyl-sn-glycerol-3-phosphate acyltransferase [Chloroflexi bacterium]|nr:1-acyl-sn-glycerol-3-phosphate acyltransferase [Chloroflexota bacterium]
MKQPLKRWLLWILWSPILLVWRMLGWRPVGDDLYTIPKVVAIGAPHTSNWDVLLFLALACHYCRAPKWMIKVEWNRPVIGPIMRFLGAVFIQRDKDMNVVDQAVREFNERHELLLVIAPEGTRKRVEYWKSGFYHIAHNANVPIALAFVDYKRKIGGVLRVMTPTGDEEADMQLIREAYEGIHARHPQNFGPVRLKPRGENLPTT